MKHRNRNYTLVFIKLEMIMKKRFIRLTKRDQIKTKLYAIVNL